MVKGLFIICLMYIIIIIIEHFENVTRHSNLCQGPVGGVQDSKHGVFSTLGPHTLSVRLGGGFEEKALLRYLLFWGNTCNRSQCSVYLTV